MTATSRRTAESTAGAHEEPDRVGTGEASTTEYAGLVTRAIAVTIDTLLIDAAAFAVGGAVALVFSLFGLWNRPEAVAAVIGGIAFAAWVIGYFVVFWTTTGQTPGCRVMRIRVVRSDGTTLKPRQALVRLGAMVLSLPLFWGYLPILTTERRRGVPDTMAGTVVVSSAAPPSTSHRHGEATELVQRNRPGDGSAAPGSGIDRDRAVNGGEAVL